MTDAATLRALAERAEAHDAGLSRTNDERLALQINAALETPPHLAGGFAALTSLDACAGLHDAVLPDWEWGVEGHFREHVAWVQPPGKPSLLDTISAGAPTPARAWLAAILRAKAAEMER